VTAPCGHPGLVTAGPLLAAIAAFAFLAFLASLARTPQSRLRIHDGIFTLRLGLIDSLLSLRRSIAVPVESITNVLVQTHVTAPPTIRLPGTSVPGLVHAGAYGSGSDLEFWNVRRGRLFLAIHLAAGAQFRKLVLEVEDPRRAATALREQLQLG
jgi:hypothetical protein